jgi:hypothetical protein
MSMKTLLSSAWIVIAINSCAPKISSAIINKQPALDSTDLVVVLQKQDSFINDGVEIGTIKSSDNGFSVNCSYPDAINHLKNLARQNGANVIKITEHKSPDVNSTCDRIKAKIYRTSDPRKFETEIEWSRDRKLIAADFKGDTKTSFNKETGVRIYCGFQYYASKVTMFNKTVIYVRTFFDCGFSSLEKNSANTAKFIEYAQGYFNLCEVYARELRKELREAKLNMSNFQSGANAILKRINSSYVMKRELYERETNHGTNKEAMAKWADVINNGLISFEAYSK